jgi:hypothetical protein
MEKEKGRLFMVCPFSKYPLGQTWMESKPII